MKIRKRTRTRRFDHGRELTDKKLSTLERKITREYVIASREVDRKAAEYFARFDAQDKAMVKRLSEGKITRAEYNVWRQQRMITGQRWTQLREQLATDLVNTDKIAAQLTRDGMADIYALNYNWGTYAIEKASKLNTSFTLVNREAVARLLRENQTLLPEPRVSIPRAMRWNQQKIQSAVTQGILQGESVRDVAKRLQSVTTMDRNAALRNARTAVTGAENAGRLDAYRRAERMGIAVKKIWEATLDHVTRDSHVDLDGEEQPLDRPFSNGMDYPGGMGPPEEVYNCRCCLRGQFDKYRTDMSDLSLRHNKLDGMSYEEWKESRRGKRSKNSG